MHTAFLTNKDECALQRALFSCLFPRISLLNFCLVCHFVAFLSQCFWDCLPLREHSCFCQYSQAQIFLFSVSNKFRVFRPIFQGQLAASRYGLLCLLRVELLCHKPSSVVDGDASNLAEILYFLPEIWQLFLNKCFSFCCISFDQFSETLVMFENLFLFFIGFRRDDLLKSFTDSFWELWPFYAFHISLSFSSHCSQPPPLQAGHFTSSFKSPPVPL